MAATCEQLTANDVQALVARDFVTAPVTFELAAAGASGGASGETKTLNRRVSSEAYTGVPFQREWGVGIFDLSTMRKTDRRERLPMLLRHSTGGMCDESLDMRLGHWDDVRITPTAVYMAGELYDKPRANEVLADAANGYPWEISIGVFDCQPEMIPPGEKRTINGREIVGTPVDLMGYGGTWVLKYGMLREGSFVEFGADPNTLPSFQLSAKRAATLADAAESKGLARLRNVVAGIGVTPSVIKQFLGIGSADRAPTPSGDSPMSTPAPTAASIEQLQSLPGADDAFVVSALKANQTLGDASLSLLKSMHEKLTAAGKSHAEALAAKDAEFKQLGEKHAAEVKALNEQLAAAKSAGGVAPVKLAGSAGGAGGDAPIATIGKGKHLTNLSGTDPEGDWNASQELQEYWKDHGGKKAFLSYAREEIRVGGDYRKLEPWANAV